VRAGGREEQLWHALLCLPAGKLQASLFVAFLHHIRMSGGSCPPWIRKTGFFLRKQLAKEAKKIGEHFHTDILGNKKVFRYFLSSTEKHKYLLICESNGTFL
jgi:hypothetical protein